MGKRSQPKHFLGREEFATKIEVEIHAKSIIARSDDFEELNSETSRSFSVFSNGTKRQIGRGALGSRSPTLPPIIMARWDGRCLWLVRFDGTKTRLGINKCVHPPKDGHGHDVREALRNEVDDQALAAIKSYRLSPGPKVCRVTGKAIVHYEAHHVPPRVFPSIAQDWLLSRGLSMEDIEVGGYGDGDATKTIADRRLAEEWKKYHSDHVVWEILSREGHKIEEGRLTKEATAAKALAKAEAKAEAEARIQDRELSGSEVA